MLWNRRKARNDAPEATLLAAVEALRAGEEGDEALESATKARILAEALESAHDPGMPASLFLPTRRLAWAGAIPVLLGVAFTLLLKHVGASPDPGTIFVAKQDGKVVFTVANGGKEHYVRRAETPWDLDRAEQHRIQGGTFEESATSGPDIVFYRFE